MALCTETAGYVAALPLPPKFAVCELGAILDVREAPHRPVKPFYQGLGCGRYEAIDLNGQGTILFDLNRKWPGPDGAFDLVTDFGTGEHIFNQAQVWRTVHRLTKPEGFIAFDRPGTGYPVHCFYLVNACLLEDLARVNGYTTRVFTKTLTTRGEVWRGVWQKHGNRPFQAPQQGRYRKSLKV